MLARIPCALVAVVLGGCLTTTEEFFSVTKGSLVPAMHSRYTCESVGGNGAKPRLPEASDTAAVARALHHMAAFRDGVHFVSPLVEKSEGRPTARYVVTRFRNDPTLASVYAFHRLYGDTYIYTVPVTEEVGGVANYALFFLRVQGTILERLEVSGEDEATHALAKRRGVALRKVENTPAYSMSGDRVDQVGFLIDLAEQQAFVKTSSCVAVGPITD